MLELKNIKKTYVTGDEKLEALKGINLKFRESEFVSILGQSGCGKTTLLNIIGGLDRYTSGDLIINGKSTKKFKDRDWDAYRNYKIGFVFQSYNLISHQTVLSNVELALTIGGISKKERKQRAIKALEEVGLSAHINKKPNQLSGGQMQRVAIARALVNNPDIILADEPTGALDTKTSVQVMEILKKISENKLIIMVTHNPELAEKYSSRIIKILDGVITEDSNPVIEKIENEKHDFSKIKRTKMRFYTAFRLSLNNLLTKKRRTVLVAFAGSIGIIGIALIQAVSNGFQNYVDSIQEDTLSSYPLSIMQESSDITSMLLSMTSESAEKGDSGNVVEKQYMSEMLSSLKANDLKSFQNYLNENYSEVQGDLKSVQNFYSVDPLIYTKDATGKIAKLNPSNLFTSMMGSSSLMSSYSSMSSIYSQMTDDKETLNESYDVLAGRWPEKYNEMIIVLSEPNSISDLLVYSLGLRDTEELTDMVTKIMTGESVDIKNEPMNFTYEDLMNVTLKLIKPTDLYKYNAKYDIYEDMTDDEEYFERLYDNAVELKIVGIVSAKSGKSSMALNAGVAYTSKLVDYIIDYSKETNIVKKQIEDKDTDVISGKKFDSENEGVGLDFQDLVSIDTKKLESAFNVKIDQNDISNKTANYMTEISNSITTDTTPAKTAFVNTLNTLALDMFNSITSPVNQEDVDGIVENYMNGYKPSEECGKLEASYVIPKDVFKTTYSGLLKALLNVYVSTYEAMFGDTSAGNSSGNVGNFVGENTVNSNVNDIGNNVGGNTIGDVGSGIGNNVISNTISPSVEYIGAIIVPDMVTGIVTEFTSSTAITATSEKMAQVMTEATMKKAVLTKVGELMNNLTESFASAFNVDQDKIASAFKLSMSEEELTRIITSMVSTTEKNAKTNLISFGYQDKEEPTYISYYFNSFDSKEHFLSFIDSYNENVIANGEEDKEIKYTDTTGILMGSVKTIVNAVTYVLIAFVSISLVVSSIMIGIITYISVYERTKEIGILRAIGASKHNISTIFNAETFIIGLLSGFFGIGTSYALIPIINTILHHFTGEIPLNVVLNIDNSTKLVFLSVILTLIGGLIPAKSASKKDPVIALRTE